jgi:acyl carrier protein
MAAANFVWMDREEAFGTFQGCVAEVLDIDESDVRLDSRWREDLDADSLAVVEITLALNDAFSIKIPDVDPQDLVTVGQAFDLVAGLAGVPPAG